MVHGTMANPPAEESERPEPSRAAPLPDAGYLGPIERLVAHAASEARLLSTLTPLNAEEERGRLTADLRAGRAPVPRWRYAPRDHASLRRALEGAEWALDRLGPTPLTAEYRARVLELCVELALCAAAGRPELGALARQRVPADERYGAQASALCDAWLDGEPRSRPEGEPLASDASDPQSLLSMMSAAIGAAKLPFSVVAQPSLASLAATGDRVVFVATRRTVYPEDARRTVLHEIEGHARPRARSLASPFSLLRAATARGVDDQEGRALLLEKRAGLLGSGRRRQLAARHRAVEAMLHGASFADTAQILKEAHGLDPADAVLVAERAFRGSDGTFPGLGRERVYMEGLLRVENHFGEHPEDEEWLEQGQVSLDAVAAFRAAAKGV
jgi:hypothetical protein